MKHMLPKRLYKYQPFSCRALDNLRNDVLWFSGPHGFNDPFDCFAVHLDADTSKEELLAEAARLEGKHADHVVQFVLRMGLLGRLHTKILNDVSVACLCERVDDMLMWAHYSDGHKGFCVEFDTTVAPFADARPVVYGELFSKLRLSQRDLEAATNQQLTNSLLRRMLRTKFSVWKYEREWRIVRGEGAHEETFDKRAITGVYMGAKMPWQHHERLGAATKQSEPTYYRMMPFPQKFGVAPFPFRFESGR
jgi:Protein of unknown function (DUF2971)